MSTQTENGESRSTLATGSRLLAEMSVSAFYSCSEIAEKCGMMWQKVRAILTALERAGKVKSYVSDLSGRPVRMWVLTAPANVKDEGRRTLDLANTNSTL